MLITVFMQTTQTWRCAVPTARVCCRGGFKAAQPSTTKKLR